MGSLSQGERTVLAALEEGLVLGERRYEAAAGRAGRAEGKETARSMAEEAQTRGVHDALHTEGSQEIGAGVLFLKKRERGHEDNAGGASCGG